MQEPKNFTHDIKTDQIIQEQSDQMFAMVDIINVYSEESKMLNKKINELEKENNKIKDIFNNQLILFMLIMIIMYFMYFKILK